MIETIIRRYLQGRSRLWLLIILICGVSVMVILPSTDEYKDSRECRVQLAASLAEMRLRVANISQLRQATAKKRTCLEELETRTISTDGLHVFRQEIVTRARNSGCQVRRIHVGDLQTRPWRQGDSLFEIEAPAAPKKPNSSYLLNSWPCSLSISGTFAGVRNLLEDLESSKRLISGNKMLLRPTPENPEQVVMDLELTLFNLTKTAGPAG